MRIKLEYSKRSSVIDRSGKKHYNEIPKLSKKSLKHVRLPNGKDKYMYTDKRGYLLSVFFSKVNDSYYVGVQSTCANDLTTNTYYDGYSVIGKLPKYIKLYSIN